MQNVATVQTSLQTKLLLTATTPSGFGASEITGYSPEQVRRVAEDMVRKGTLVRAKVSPRRVRYFATEEIAQKYSADKPSSVALASRAAPGSRVKARWSADEPMRITAKTKIYVAPPLPRDVFRTNTYAKF